MVEDSGIGNGILILIISKRVIKACAILTNGGGSRIWERKLNEKEGG